LEKLEVYSQCLPLPVHPAVSPLFIVQPLTGFSVQKLFSTHPPTAERVTRLRHLGRLPVAGEHFTWNGLRFEVIDMDRHRIDKILVQPERTADVTSVRRT
jgi:Mg2+/Co2+ transporter CorC